MKKFFTGLFALCMCAVCALSLVACGAKYSETTVDTTNVSANGGMSLVYNDELYFVNGKLDNDGKNNGGNTVGSVYKVALDQEGKIAEDATYTKVVDALVGFQNGSIHIFGDYLYYVAPSTARNNKADVLYKKTKFMRKDLVNGTTQEIYGTEESTDTLTYAYYVVGEKLLLVVYDKTSKTIVSVEVGTEMKKTCVIESVASAIFSDNFGKSSTENADNFIFYTRAVDENNPDQNTNRLYFAKPDGSKQTLLCDTANLSLLTIRAGKLLVTASFGSSPDDSTEIYAFDITSETQKIVVSDEGNSKAQSVSAFKQVVSYKTYDDVIFVEDDGNVGMYCLTGNVLAYVQYDGTSTSPTKYIELYTFSSTPSLDMIGLFTDTEDSNHVYCLFSNSNVVYKIRVDFDSQTEVDGENPEPKKLSTTNINTDSSNGLLVPKIVGNYVYVLAKKDDDVLLQRINIWTPKELNDRLDPAEQETDQTKLEVKEAEVVGGKDL